MSLSFDVFGDLFSGALNFCYELETIAKWFAGYGLKFEFDYLISAFTYMATQLAVYIVLYVFMGIGVYRLSVNNGVSTPALAFVPFARYYQIGKLVGSVRLFGISIKNIGLIVTIAAAADFVCANLYDLLVYGRLFVDFVNEVPVTLPESTFVTYLVDIVNVVYVVFFVFMTIALFRNYERRFFVLYSLLGLFFGITGIFVFVIRNHKKIDPAEEIRRFYQSRGMGENGRFGGPDMGGGAYSDRFYYNDERKNTNNSSHPAEKPQPDVFEEYSDKSGKANGDNGDPFLSYNNGKDDDHDDWRDDVF